MGFTKRHLQELDILLERRTAYETDKDFLDAVVGRCDMLVGSCEAMEYIDSLYSNIKKNIKND